MGFLGAGASHVSWETMPALEHEHPSSKVIVLNSNSCRRPRNDKVVPLNVPHVPAPHPASPGEANNRRWASGQWIVHCIQCSEQTTVPPPHSKDRRTCWTRLYAASRIVVHSRAAVGCVRPISICKVTGGEAVSNVHREREDA